MRVVVLAAVEQTIKLLVRERGLEFGPHAANKLDVGFRRIVRLLRSAELGSTRRWAPASYKFVLVDAFHLIWRYSEDRRTRVVVRVAFQAADPARTAKDLP